MHTPLLDKFNTLHTMIRWCTPSIHPDLPQARDIYANDMSISYHELGTPLADTGVFGEATALAAKAYQADHTLFCVQGTSTCNFMVLRALKQQLGDVKMLGTRNAHMSVATACNDYDIEFIPIEPQYNQKMQIFVPNTLQQILDGITQHQPNVLFLSNPTYEGNALDLAQIVPAVRAKDPQLIIFVDEGWGAHFSFSSLMPTSAMQAGVDVCTQSTHKQGCALQGASMIHWKDGRVDHTEMMRTYRALSTTSPSFHMLAALDGTRAFMEERGEEVIKATVQIANYFVDELATVPEVEVTVASDPTKLLLHFPHHSAPEIAAGLEAEGIIVEKYEARNITIIVCFQSTPAHVDLTVRTLKAILASQPKQQNAFPHFPTAIERTSKAAGAVRAVTLDKAKGLISDEYIIPYPPGIPLIGPGEVIRDEHLDYIRAVQKNKLMTLFMSDPGQVKVR